MSTTLLDLIKIYMMDKLIRPYRINYQIPNSMTIGQFVSIIKNDNVSAINYHTKKVVLSIDELHFISDIDLFLICLNKN